jgi:amino acid transporter
MITTNVSPVGRSPEKRKGDQSLASEEYAIKALPPILRTRDMVAIFLSAIVFITNAATAASGGAASYIYWILGGITFFIPSVIATAQLGVLFPFEGSIYNWTYRTLGSYWAFFVGLCWWFPVVLILISASDTIVTYIQGLNPAWLAEPWQQGLTIMVILIATTFLATRRARVVQNLVNFGACLILCAVTLIAIAGIRWLISGHPSATSFNHPADWSINANNFALLGLITLAYLGSQVPLNMGGEMVGNSEGERRKNIIQHLQLGTILVFVCYFLATFALLVVEGSTNGSVPFALIDTVDKSLGKFWGNLTVMCIMGAFFCAVVMYNASFARILFVGSVDRRVPINMGRLNKQRVPVNGVIVQTVLAMIFTAFAFLVVPYTIKLNSPANLATIIYNVSLAVVSLVWALITNFFYIALFKLYLRDRGMLREKAILPIPVLLAISIIGPISCIATIVDSVLYSWIPTLIPNGTWTLVVSGVVVISFTLVALGSMFATTEAAWQNWTT